MSKIPQDLMYTEEHEWIRFDSDNEVTVGITDYAQDSLGDVVFVEMPEVGAEVEKGASISTIESVKAVSDIYAPLSGSISAINDEISSEPALVNSDPYGKGWLFKMTLSNPAEKEALSDAASYEKFLSSL